MVSRRLHCGSGTHGSLPRRVHHVTNPMDAGTRIMAGSEVMPACTSIHRVTAVTP